MAAALLIDLTRLVSRQGKGALTGVDRVELAWLDHLLGQDVPLHGLVRTPVGYLLFGRDGAALVSALAHRKAPPPATDLLGRLVRRGDPPRAGAEAGLRRLARARAAGPFLAASLRRVVPAGAVYLNLGHTNLTDRTLGAVRAAGLRVAVLVHDTIPLDHPGFSRAGTPEAFGRKLGAVARHADLVIHTAQATRTATEAHLARAGRVPSGIVAPLGVTVAPPDPAALPAGLDLTRPCFVALGTVEPRKNHALLLDVWARLAQGDGPLPQLLILGNRGWADPALLARLDGGPEGVTELSGLADGAVSALLAASRGLLFPSFAEGYGLPPLEAAALGVPVVCSDLPVLRELLSDYPVYLDPSDSYSWERVVRTRTAGDGRTAPESAYAIPAWEAHFNAVLSQFA
jgi:glycosyltransferase involved in cell wall biosynthesis